MIHHASKGLLTFLFTDLEGSTSLWENFPKEMRSAVALHDNLMREIIKLHKGWVVKTTGDGFHAVFETPSDGIAAALAGQLALTAESWTEATGPLKVRMGLNTGESQEREGDYYGPAVNLAARVMALGHGGQVLLSQNTATLIRSQLPDECSLEDLGEHRIKGIAAPERIFQLCHPELTAEFPPLKSLSTFKHNLRRQLSSFIGREKEIKTIKRLLAETRILTLLGPGGTGKTRLLLQAAEEVIEYYPDGVWLVELASLNNPKLIPHRMADSLNVQQQPGRGIVDTLIEHLGKKELLLLLDNVEHLVRASAGICQELLERCPALKILVTGREALHIPGETTLQIPSLSLPGEKQTLEAIAAAESVELFLERARSVQPGFKITPENAPTIAEIVRRLDGIPLALELAAARLRILTVEQIATRLDNRFVLLKSDQQGRIDQRHQTLQAAIDWSYDLLKGPEKRLLQRLSVFAGGCSLNEAEMVCPGGGIEREDILDLLSSLANKSLVIADTLQRREAHYSLLETIRQYGREKMQMAGDWSQLRDRHLQCFYQLTTDIEPRLWEEDQQVWLDRLADDNDNIRAAISWSLESGQIESGLRIANAMYQFWTIRDHAEEGLNWVEKLLEQADEGVASVVRATALDYAVNLSTFRGNVQAADFYEKKATELAAEIGDEDEEALMWILSAQSFSARIKGDHETAFELGERQIELVRKYKDPLQVGMSLTIFSFMALSLGKYDRARALLNEGLPLLRQAGNPYRLAMALNFSGDLARCERNYPEAQNAYEESINLLRGIGAVRDLASVFHNLGHTCLHLGETDRAAALFMESMNLHREQGNRPGMTECLLGFAALAIVSGLTGVGATLLTVAATIGGRHVTTDWAATRMEYEHYQDRAQAGLSASAYASALATGQRLSLEQAVTLGEDVIQKTTVVQQSRRQLDELTPREREVARLIALGKSNDEIAAELVISKRTVETHITHIRAKLDFSKRAQIVRWAITVGLTPIDDRIHL